MLIGACAVWTSRLARGQDDVPALGGALQNALKSIETTADGKRNLVIALADDLETVPQSDYWIGVQVAAVPDVAKKQLAIDDGLAVEEVTQDSPAAKAEIKKFDILVKAGDAPLKNITDLVKAVDASQGKEVIITIVRDGKNQTIKVIPDKRPKSESVEIVKRAVAAARPELAAEIKQLEEALEKLKNKAGKDGVGFWFAKPAVVAPQVDYKVVPFPKDLSVQINKESGNPAKIHVKRGDKEWNITEDNQGLSLKDLPDDIRSHVQRLMAGIPVPGKMNVSNRVVRVTPEGKVEGEMRIAPQPPAPPKPPTAPQAATPPKPPTAQANRTFAIRSPRAEGDADSKLDAIIKKLDERSESIEKLDKKVEDLRKELDQLRTKAK